MPYLRKFAKNLDAIVGADVRQEVLEGCEAITAKSSKIKRAHMMKEVMDRMEKIMDKDVAIQIRENCACKPKDFLMTSIELYKKYPNINDFINELQKTHFAGKLKIEKNIIYGTFNMGKCVCGMVKATKETIPMLWCECCKGHVKWLWEETLKKPLRVEMLESIISGSDDCKFKIYFE